MKIPQTLYNIKICIIKACEICSSFFSHDPRFDSDWIKFIEIEYRLGNCIQLEYRLLFEIFIRF